MWSALCLTEEALEKEQVCGREREECEFRLGHGEFKDAYRTFEGDERQETHAI